MKLSQWFLDTLENSKLYVYEDHIIIINDEFEFISGKSLCGNYQASPVKVLDSYEGYYKGHYNVDCELCKNLAEDYECD